MMFYLVIYLEKDLTCNTWLPDFCLDGYKSGSVHQNFFIVYLHTGNINDSVRQQEWEYGGDKINDLQMFAWWSYSRKIYNL